MRRRERRAVPESRKGRGSHGTGAWRGLMPAEHRLLPRSVAILPMRITQTSGPSCSGSHVTSPARSAANWYLSGFGSWSLTRRSAAPGRSASKAAKMRACRSRGASVRTSSVTGPSHATDLRGVCLNDLRLCTAARGDEQDEIGLRRRTMNHIRGERQEHPGMRGIGRILRCQRALTPDDLNRDRRRDAMVAQMLPRTHTDQEHLARQRRLQLHRGRVPVVKSDVPFERDQVFVDVRVHATFPASPVFAIGLGMPPR